MRADPIQTARLRIRLLTPDDAVDAAAYYARNADRQRRTGPFGAHSTTVAHWQERLANVTTDVEAGKAARWGLFTEDGRTLVGMVSITDAIRGPLLAANLGYSLDREAEGKGYLAEALPPLIDWAFGEFGLHRLDAGYPPWNARSGNVLARLGFRVEGYSTRLLFLDGVWTDSVRTAMDVEAWGRVRRR